MRSVVLMICVGSLSGLAWASPDPVCQRLIPSIAKEVSVPVSILNAVSSVESQHQPYALNHNGTSLSFKTPREAWAYAEKHLNTGVSNIDMGCMQVNWRAHQDTIGDARKLLIPSFNIRYAARFLKHLKRELGSWSQAVAAYHSRTKEKGHSYLIKVAKVLKKEKQDGAPLSLTVPRLALTGFTVWKKDKLSSTLTDGFNPQTEGKTL